MAECSRETFHRWEQDRVTQAFKDQLRQWIEDKRAEYDTGGWIDPTDVANTGASAVVLYSEIKILGDILNFSYEDLPDEGEEDAEDFTGGAQGNYQT